MSKFKLIYFEGCPNAKHARAVLLAAQADFEVIKQDDLPQNNSFLDYSSPSILKDDCIIFGQKLSQGSSACSFEKIDEKELKNKILNNDKNTSPVSTNPKDKKGFLATIGSIGAGMTVGLCPVCIPAIGAFLASIGLGFMGEEIVLKPLLILFLAIALFGYFWSYLKVHNNIYPFLVGTVMAVGLYIGRYIYISGTWNSIIMYGSIVGIIGVSIWNWRLRKKRTCNSCITN